MIFPEAVWNLSPNKLILDIFLGTVKAAIETNSIIVCSAVERYGKNYFINQKVIDFTKMIDSPAFKDEEGTSKKILLECNQSLRDTLATALWEIWEFHSEKAGIERRADIPSDYWEGFFIGTLIVFPMNAGKP